MDGKAFQQAVPVYKEVMRQHFRSILRGEGGESSWKFITIPFDVQRTFGVSGRIPVRGTLNGFPFRSSLACVNGVHLLGIDGRLRRQARLDAAPEVDVVLDVDAPPRAMHLPAQLRRALEADDFARRRFDELPLEHRREFARWVGAAKQRQTKEQRAAHAVELIKSGRTLI